MGARKPLDGAHMEEGSGAKSCELMAVEIKNSRMTMSLHLNERAFGDGVELSQIGKVEAKRGTIRKDLRMEGVMLFFVESGTLEVSSAEEEEVKVCGGGEMLVVFPGRTLTLKAVTGLVRFHFLVLVGATVMRGILKLGFWDGFQAADEVRNGFLDGLIESFEASARRGRDEQVLAQLEQFLSMQWRRVRDQSPHGVFMGMVRSIHALGPELLTTEKVAEALDVSRTKLNVVFMEGMGMRPGKYLAGVRTIVIRELLGGPFLSVARIAELVGFSSASALAGFFKRQVGMLPSTYRNRVLGMNNW